MPLRLCVIPKHTTYIDSSIVVDGCFAADLPRIRSSSGLPQIRLGFVSDSPQTRRRKLGADSTTMGLNIRPTWLPIVVWSSLIASFACAANLGAVEVDLYAIFSVFNMLSIIYQYRSECGEYAIMALCPTRTLFPFCGRRKLDRFDTFVDSKEWQCTKVLELNWRVILEELEQAEKKLGKRIKSAYSGDAFTDLGGSSWKALNVIGWGMRSEHSHLFPRTLDILSKCEPPIVNCLFSTIPGGTHLTDHHGESSNYVRSQLALRVPPEVKLPEAGLRCGDDEIDWKEGKTFTFYDIHWHTAWNKTKRERTVMIYDVMAPGMGKQKNRTSSIMLTIYAVSALLGVQFMYEDTEHTQYLRKQNNIQLQKKSYTHYLLLLPALALTYGVELRMLLLWYLRLFSIPFVLSSTLVLYFELLQFLGVKHMPRWLYWINSGTGFYF